MLSTVFSKEKTQSIIDVMPDEMIVWKVVTYPGYYNGDFIKDVWNSAYPHNGLYTSYIRGQVAENLPRGAISEQPGYHSFVRKKSAEWYMENFLDKGRMVVSASIQTSDISAVGTENFCHMSFGLVVVTSRIVMPTYPNTDITKELREAPLVEDCVEVMELMEVSQ